MSKSVYDEVMQYFSEAKSSFEIGNYRPAANSMRCVAEVLATFYIDHYKLEKSYESIKEKKHMRNGYNGKRNLTCRLYTLRSGTSKYCDEFRRSLLVFLAQIKKNGNAGSHSGEELERWEVEFLIRFFEKNILNQFATDSGAKGSNNPDLEDVTQKYDGHSVLIYSLAAEKYASAIVDSDMAPVNCDTDNRDAWETYHIEVDQQGWASLKASNGKYLSVDLDEDRDYPPIRAIGPKSLEWEKFKIYKYDGHFVLKAGCNNKWVTCRIDWDCNPLYATCDNIDWWEEFDIEEI